jgi:hypothetical protein
MAKKHKGRMGYDGGAAPHGGFSFRDWQQAAQRGAQQPPQPQPPSALSFFAPFGAPPPGAEQMPAPTPAPEPARELQWYEAVFGRPTTVAKPKAAEPTRPSIPAWVKPRVDPSPFFDLKGLYEYVVQQRVAPGFRVPPGSVGTMQLLMISRPSQDPVKAISEIASYFRIPPAEIQRYGEQAWPALLEPFLKDMAMALDYYKPKEIPGNFVFEFAQDGSLGLSYHERG